MGAYKDKTGKTRVGTVLQSIGGFFSGIFKKKSTTTSTSIDTSKVKTTTPKLATPPIATTGAFDWSGLAVALGTAGLGWLSTKLPDPNASGLSDEERQAIITDNQETAKSTGNGIFIIIVGVVLAIASFFIFRKK